VAICHYLEMSVQIIQGDCLEVMRTMPDQSVDLVFDSPPYEDARTYGIDFKLCGEDWVDWMFERTVEALRVCRGLVATVVEGKTRDFRYSAAPILLMADLDRRGYHLRKPPVFHRVGIPGSGGPDWLRNDYEFIVCCTNGGRLPWSDNTACGHPPKWAPGGAMSNRNADGRRKNARGYSGNKRFVTKQKDGMHGGQENSPYTEPRKANPGNTIQRTYTADEVAAMLPESGDVTHRIVGGGVMGNRLCHEKMTHPTSMPAFHAGCKIPEPAVPCGLTPSGRERSGIPAGDAHRLQARHPVLAVGVLLAL
jgi:hypothetical protein